MGSKPVGRQTIKISNGDASLYAVRCENCGTGFWSVTDRDVPNCDSCPGHDDIARRNQESADRDACKTWELAGFPCPRCGEVMIINHTGTECSVCDYNIEQDKNNADPFAPYRGLWNK